MAQRVHKGLLYICISSCIIEKTSSNLLDLNLLRKIQKSAYFITMATNDYLSVTGYLLLNTTDALLLFTTVQSRVIDESITQWLWIQDWLNG